MRHRRKMHGQTDDRWISISWAHSQAELKMTVFFQAVLTIIITGTGVGVGWRRWELRGGWVAMQDIRGFPVSIIIIIICNSYIALFLSKLAQSTLHIITPGRPLTSITCSTPCTPAYIMYTLQDATGNLSTIAISVYHRVFIYGWVNWGTTVVTCSTCGTFFDELSGFGRTRTQDVVVWSPMR